MAPATTTPILQQSVVASERRSLQSALDKCRHNSIAPIVGSVLVGSDPIHARNTRKLARLR